MPETISLARRSWIMSRVAAKNTPAELRVRKVAHSLGLRFRLHRADLPGKPDIVFPKYRVAVFVHGCFWHRHRGCTRARMPRTNQAYWRKKFRSNIVRDRRVIAEIASLGWRTFIFWECETSDVDAIKRRLRREIVGRHATRLGRRNAR
jgi:DNA mismatch endonuclease (patch repair protein)